MAGVGAPHAGRRIDDLAAVDGKIMHALSAGEQPWRLLEGPVGGKRHPVRGKVVGDVDGGGAWALVQHGGPLQVLGRSGFRGRVEASLRDGTATLSLICAQSGALRIGMRRKLPHKPAAPIQNTSPSDSSVSSQRKSVCG